MSEVITEPGVYQVPETDYHAGQNLAPRLGRSLSATACKTLLANPARFLYERDHGRPPKDIYDIGTLAHELILRGGDDRLVVVDAYDWRGKAAQEAKRAAHAERKVPVHRGDLLAATALARSVRRHSLASAILSEGQPEQSIYWLDEETGVTCRGRIDWLRDNAIVDVKTTTYGGTDAGAFGRAAASFDYPLQAAHYQDGIEALTGRRLPFLFIVVEKEPPYFVRVHQLTDYDLEVGRERAREARHLFAEYESNGYPDVGADIETTPLPGWYGRSVA